MNADLGPNSAITLKNGTVIRIDENYGLIWIHPSGDPAEGSFRVNLKLKLVDVLVGADWTKLTHEKPKEDGKNE